jgi:hypothetical protein
MRRFGLVVLVPLMACATTPTPSAPLFDTPPRLAGCAEPEPTGPYIVRVWLTFTVDEQGAVVPATIQPVHARAPALDHWAIQSAKERAVHCMYEPALRDGDPVSAQAQQIFRVAYR